MPLLRKPLYQRSEGADDDRWRLAFDTDSRRLFVEHEQTRGDMRGWGYATMTDEIDLAAFLRDEGVKGIVIACNTATAHALTALREEFDMPHISPGGLESRSGRPAIVVVC